MTDQGTERLHALDAVRGFALIAGVIFHATMSFLPAPPGVPVWIVMDSHRSLTLGVVFNLLHTFRMTTFFVIAGFFAHMTFHRWGARGFVADRLKRIAVPLVVGWPFLFAAVVAVTIWAAISAAHGLLQAPPASAYPGFPAFPLTHLWFLYVLLLLYAATLIVRGLVALVDRSGAFRRGVDTVVRGLAGNPLGLIALAAPVCLALYVSRDWLPWFGIPTPDSSLVPTLGAAVGFGVAFGFGWVLHRQTALLGVWREKRWPLNLALGVALSAAGFAMTGVAPMLATFPAGWLRFADAACYSLASWAWTFAVIGMALRFLNDFSPARRYIADASYWLYIVHLPIVMALQVVVSQLNWPWEVKFPVILAVAFPLMFASYELLVRHSFHRRHPQRTALPLAEIAPPRPARSPFRSPPDERRQPIRR